MLMKIFPLYSIGTNTLLYDYRSQFS